MREEVARMHSVFYTVQRAIVLAFIQCLSDFRVVPPPLRRHSAPIGRIIIGTLTSDRVGRRRHIDETGRSDSCVRHARYCGRTDNLSIWAILDGPPVSHPQDPHARRKGQPNKLSETQRYRSPRFHRARCRDYSGRRCSRQNAEVLT